jgi:hypothetical protein
MYDGGDKMKTKKGHTIKVYPDYVDMSLLTAAPTGTEGRLYYDSAAHKLYYYNGTSWVEVGAVTKHGLVPFPPAIRGTYSVAAGASQVLSEGIYMFVCSNYPMRLSIYYDGAWRDSANSDTNAYSGTVISDGTNVRVVNASGSIIDFRYLKFPLGSLVRSYTFGTGSIGAGAYFTPSRGLFSFIFSGLVTAQLYIDSLGAWYSSSARRHSYFSFIYDGVNQRIYNQGTAAVTYYYIQLNFTYMIDNYAYIETGAHSIAAGATTSFDELSNVISDSTYLYPNIRDTGNNWYNSSYGRIPTGMWIGSPANAFYNSDGTAAHNVYYQKWS